MYNTNAKNIPKLCSLELELVTDGVGVATVDSAVDFIGAKRNCKEKVHLIKIKFINLNSFLVILQNRIY